MKTEPKLTTTDKDEKEIKDDKQNVYYSGLISLEDVKHLRLASVCAGSGADATSETRSKIISTSNNKE